ncbi:quinone oxidoreductase [Pyrenophora seminiperda CCB06]|uniref:Quinone oxidoreductase n=1 Tax=Pyrenophora seminiperda CCB06 TaxID=1302712 RepID=A0A3M7M211_9PLEO|nr:quinone oxidoreductase [Pyrenophora seminiperda CCB06]
MHAIAVTEYGAITTLKTVDVPKPSSPQGHDLVVRIKACSVNPVDTKVRAGTYDDYPDYYERTPKLPQILGFDGAGVIESVGPQVTHFKPGDEIYYAGSPIRQGSNAEFQLVDSRAVALKPKSLDWGQAAAMPLTWITAYEALVERMEIQKGENAGILIINGAGGVGSVASQIARHVLNLPVVITTASRDETVRFSKDVGGATHTVNHHEDIAAQVEQLNLDVPIKYIFITHTPTSAYLAPAAKICAPFGKVCSIVQDKEMPMYGTEFMAKSLTFVWALLGTKPYYGVDVESHGRILSDLAEMLDKGTVKCHCTQKLKVDEKGKGARRLEKLRWTMTVISGGTATIRFGVADAADWAEGKYEPGERGEEGEEGGVEIKAGLGDVFIVPAGVSHKTFLPEMSASASTPPSTLPPEKPQVKELGFWQLGSDEAISDAERATYFDTNINLHGNSELKGTFMMMGAYPRGGQWDFCVGGEHSGKEESVWKVPVPREDPVLGSSKEGVVGIWKEVV